MVTDTELCHFENEVVTQFEGAAGGAPAWFANGLANGLAPILNSLAQLQALVRNAQATRGDDNIFALPNAQGVLPVPFPATRNALGSLSAPQTNALVAFYGVAVAAPATLPQRRNALRTYLGIPHPDFA